MESETNKKKLNPRNKNNEKKHLIYASLNTSLLSNRRDRGRGLVLNVCLLRNLSNKQL